MHRSMGRKLDGLRVAKQDRTSTRLASHGSCIAEESEATFPLSDEPSQPRHTSMPLSPLDTRPPRRSGIRSRSARSDQVVPRSRLLDLNPRELLKAAQKESLGFWALCFYIFIEYVRPQQVWEFLDVLPWGMAALAAALGLSLLEPSNRPRPFTTLDGWLTAYSLILIASLVTAFNPGFGIETLEVYVNWLLLFYLTTRFVNTERRLLIFFLLFLLWSLKMSQHGARSLVFRGFGFESWGATGGPGWFHNSGEFAIQMAVFLPMSLHWILGMRHRWPMWQTAALLALLPGTAFLSLVASSSRGGQLAGAGVLLFMIAQSRRRVRGLLAVAVVLPLLWFVTPPEQKERFESMGEDGTSVSRLVYWEDGMEIASRHPVLGIGYDNWIPYYRTFYNPFGELPHNVFVEAASELGYTGLIAFLALIGATFTANAQTRRRARHLGEWTPFIRSMALGLDAALVGFLIGGFFVTVLYYPFFWMNLAFTAALFLTALNAYKARGRMEAASRRHEAYGRR